jgi:hypothetical protein
MNDGLKLSKRMIFILGFLAKAKLADTMEQAKERLTEYNKKVAPILLQLGERPKTVVTDGEAMQNYMESISADIKTLILISYRDLREHYRDMNTAIDHYEESKYLAPGTHADFRHKISLVELVSGKFYPKGRQGWNGLTCGQCEDYWDNYMVAQTAYASFSRTMKKLERQNLIAVYHSPDRARKLFYITDKGLSVLSDYRTVNTSKQDNPEQTALMIREEVSQ